MNYRSKPMYLASTATVRKDIEAIKKVGGTGSIDWKNGTAEALECSKVVYRAVMRGPRGCWVVRRIRHE